MEAGSEERSEHVPKRVPKMFRSMFRTRSLSKDSLYSSTRQESTFAILLKHFAAERCAEATEFKTGGFRFHNSHITYHISHSNNGKSYLAYHYSKEAFLGFALAQESDK